MMKRNFIILAFVFIQIIRAQWIINTSPSPSSFNSIYFVTKNIGILTTSTAIYKTTDRGVSWNKIELDSTFNLYNIFFVDSLTGFISGSKGGNGVILKTINCGITWDIIPVGFGNVFFDASFISNKVGWIFGEVGSLVGKIGKTTDGGLTWTDLQTDAFGPLLSGCFVDSLNGWSGGEKPTLIRTTDGGRNWLAIDTLFMRSDSAVPIRSIHFIDDNYGWIVGGIAEYNAIWKTTSGGKSWTHRLIKPKIPQPDFGVARLNDVFFTDQFNGYVVGRDISSGKNNGLILYSADGGESWVVQDKKNASELNSVMFLTDSIGWTVGDQGTILSTVNRGISFVNYNKNKLLILSIFQNFPNPFNPVTKILFELPQSQFTTLSVYDNLGRTVCCLINEILSKGNHSVIFDAQSYNLSSGIYFYQIRTEYFSITKSMILIK